MTASNDKPWFEDLLSWRLKEDLRTSLFSSPSRVFHKVHPISSDKKGANTLRANVFPPRVVTCIVAGDTQTCLFSSTPNTAPDFVPSVHRVVRLRHRQRRKTSAQPELSWRKKKKKKNSFGASLEVQLKLSMFLKRKIVCLLHPIDKPSK